MNSIQELVKFTLETKYDDLPDKVVLESKRTLLDTIGCALAGTGVDKGKCSIEFAGIMGGRPEASVIGAGKKVSCSAAAFANGELINALEYEPVLAPPGHVSSCAVSGPLAMAEYLKSSGRDLILAIALSHEFAARLGRSMDAWREVIKEGPDKGKTIFPNVTGGGYMAISGAAVLARLMKLDPEKTANAIGVAGYFSPVPSAVKFFTTLPGPFAKSCSSGWVAMAQVAAAQVASTGYTGDVSLFEGPHGFYRMFGSKTFDNNILTDKLGSAWCFHDQFYKRYPCIYVLHTCLDVFIKLIAEKKISAKDIKEINILTDSVVEAGSAPFDKGEIKTHVDGQFVTPYVFSAAAHGLKPLDWQDPKNVRDPEILQFMNKVHSHAHPKFSAKKKQDPRTHLGAVEIITQKGTFTGESSYNDLMDDKDLEKKFRENAARVLSPAKIDRFIDLIRSLEKVPDCSEVMKTVAG